MKARLNQVKENNQNPPCNIHYKIEPATKEETKKAEKRIKEYHEDPSSFILWNRRKNNYHE